MGKTARNPGFNKWYPKVEALFKPELGIKYPDKHRWIEMYQHGMSPQQALTKVLLNKWTPWDKQARKERYEQQS